MFLQVYNDYIIIALEEIKMLFNNRVPIKGIVYPEALKNKLQFAANCNLSENEVQCFSQALVLVTLKMEEDIRNGKLPPKVDNLRRVTIIFTENGELSFSGIKNEIGINVSLIIYKMKPLRYFNTYIFSLFVFIEEWHIIFGILMMKI